MHSFCENDSKQKQTALPIAIASVEHIWILLDGLCGKLMFSVSQIQSNFFLGLLNHLKDPVQFFSKNIL